jgi:hypothetical protein
VYITNSRFAIRQNDKIDVKVYSNLDDVELIVNGESLGNTKGDFATYKWENVALQKDMNKVEAIAYKNGQSYSSSVVWMYEKKPAISFGIAFLRWLIKPFLGLLFLAAVFLVWILVKKRPKRWGKALTIIVLVLSVLILAAFIVGQILGAKFGFNLFEYSLL